MSKYKLKWIASFSIFLLILIAYGIWSYQCYLRELKTTDVLLSRNLKSHIQKNRELQNKIIEELENSQELLRYGIEISISKLRGLPFREPVHYGKLEPSSIKDRIVSRFWPSYNSKEFRNHELALKRIGLLPKRSDLLNEVAAALPEQTAFYDFNRHEICVLNSSQPKYFMIFLISELVHALQDQNFQIRSLMLHAKDNEDAMLAVSALIQGDAMYQTNLYLKENFRAAQLLRDQSFLFHGTERLTSAPPYVRDFLEFPYQVGELFAAEIYTWGGNSALNAAYNDPPRSTEQVLHPEKYLGTTKNLPKEISFSFKVEPSWKKLHENVVGEWGIRSMFSELVGIKRSSQIAAGWGGDRYVLYETVPEKWILVWKTLWDSEKDAREFFDALECFYRSYYEAIHVDFHRLESGKSLSLGASAESVFFSWANQKQNITMRGKTVLFLDVPDSKMMNRLLPEFIKGINE